VPTLHDIAVEDHIRGAVRDLLRTRGATIKRGLIADLHGSRKVPLKGVKNRLSVQASAPYDAVKQEKQRTMLLHKLLTASKGVYFVSGGKTNVIESNVQPLCVGDPFMDAWANPIMTRGVPANQQQLQMSVSTRRPLHSLPTFNDKPFYTRTEGNTEERVPNRSISYFQLYCISQPTEVKNNITQYTISAVLYILTRPQIAPIRRPFN
jgi:hypothetical protein